MISARMYCTLAGLACDWASFYLGWPDPWSGLASAWAGKCLGFSVTVLPLAWIAWPGTGLVLGCILLNLT